MPDENEKRIRLDKWLKIARIYKTRSKASDGCEQGRVTVNDQVAKPSKMIKIGDRIVVRVKTVKRTFDVLDIAHKSISAEKARLLYHEHALSEAEVEELELRKAFFKSIKKMKPKYKGRPTKKERRQIDKLKGQ